MSKGIDVNKTSDSRKFIICNYYYFRKVNVTFQPNVCDGCHDLMQKAITVNDVATVSLKRNYHRICFWCRSKVEAINLLNNISLKEESGSS